MSEKEIIELQGKLRLRILEMYKAANAGHIACSLSCIDLVIAGMIQHRSKDDVFILSKGHAAVALYVCLEHLGEISGEQMKTYYLNGTSLTAHPAPSKFGSIPLATGSLGHGLPYGTGVAKAMKLAGRKHFVTVLMSDGETNEGTTWEAAHFARQHELDNLIVIVDKNGLQGFGNTEEVLGDTSTKEQWSALGFEVHECDGHDALAAGNLLSQLKKSTNKKPKVILAQTVKGKGVAYMEDKLEWHYLPMKEEQYAEAAKSIAEKYKL